MRRLLRRTADRRLPYDANRRSMMRIGMVTDSLGHLPLDDLLQTTAELGIEMLEFPCGNWSSAPHMRLDAMLDSAAARDEFMAKLRHHGITLSALNCSGNQLHPGELGR